MIFYNNTWFPVKELITTNFDYLRSADNKNDFSNFQDPHIKVRYKIVKITEIIEFFSINLICCHHTTLDLSNKFKR